MSTNVLQVSQFLVVTKGGHTETQHPAVRCRQQHRLVEADRRCDQCPPITCTLYTISKAIVIADTMADAAYR